MDQVGKFCLACQLVVVFEGCNIGLWVVTDCLQEVVLGPVVQSAKTLVSFRVCTISTVHSTV